MGTMEAPLETVLEEVRERLRLHAGGIELVSADEASGKVAVRFLGTCRTCPLAKFTLKNGVESVFKERLPWVQEVSLVD